MAVDNVPWMIEGNVEHSTNVARLLSYAAFGGTEGIIGPADLEVRELAVPGTQVRVYPGAGAILNRAAGAAYEAYAFRAPTETRVDIAPTGSGGGRSDLLVARVENPFLGGEPWADPAAGAEQDYQYLRLAIISGVAANSKGAEIATYRYSAIPLARIDIPASTGTITQAMIRDLRQMTQVRKAETFNIVAPAAAEALTGTAYQNWPNAANMDVDIPAWATHVQCRAILGGIAFGAGSGAQNVWGNLRIQVGASADADVFYSQPTGYNVSNPGGADRITLMAGSPSMPIPKTKRGTTTIIQIEGNKVGGNTSLTSDASSMVSIEVRFLQAPETNI